MKPSPKLTKEQLDPYFLEWECLSVQLADLHKQRNKAAAKLIQEGLTIYKKLLAHCRDALQDNEFEPLNGAERLSFIESSPGTYAAYRQLAELFVELKKIIARKRIEFKHLNES
ncbi:MAG: YpoC family protein [Planococcus donghaensis]